MEKPHVNIEVKINGMAQRLRIEPRETLLDVLRNRLGLIGAKRSCDMQICGSCTVLVDNRAVSACTYLAYEADGKDITTIEGLANGDQLHPVQEAFLEAAAFQCGFCTSGFILTACALLAEGGPVDEERVRSYLDGNICRCTGYKPIIEAIQTAARRQASGENSAS